MGGYDRSADSRVSGIFVALLMRFINVGSFVVAGLESKAFESGNLLMFVVFYS